MAIFNDKILYFGEKMKKIFLLFLIITLVFIFGCKDKNYDEAVSKKTTTLECPNNIINDPYPGSCGRYTDNDNNGICDLGQTI